MCELSICPTKYIKSHTYIPKNVLYHLLCQIISCQSKVLVHQSLIGTYNLHNFMLLSEVTFFLFNKHTLKILTSNYIPKTYIFICYMWINFLFIHGYANNSDKALHKTHTKCRQATIWCPNIKKITFTILKFEYAGNIIYGLVFHNIILHRLSTNKSVSVEPSINEPFLELKQKNDRGKGACNFINLCSQQNLFYIRRKEEHWLCSYYYQHNCVWICHKGC